MKELQRVHVHSKDSILVVVDMENEFCTPGGRCFPPPRATTVPPVVSAIQKLAERFRSARIPIIYIQSVRTLKEAAFTVFGTRPHLEVGGWGVEIIDELKPQQGDTVVQKFSHDPFFRPDLDRVLRRLVPDPTKCYAVVTGGGVSTCVRHTVMGFYLRDYWTVVPVDCVVYTLESDKEQALQHFSQHGYPNIFLSHSNLIGVSDTLLADQPRPVPGR